MLSNPSYRSIIGLSTAWVERFAPIGNGNADSQVHLRRGLLHINSNIAHDANSHKFIDIIDQSNSLLLSTICVYSILKLISRLALTPRPLRHPYQIFRIS